jgi:hypothetical protein
MKTKVNLGERGSKMCIISYIVLCYAEDEIVPVLSKSLNMMGIFLFLITIEEIYSVFKIIKKKNGK